MHSAKPATKVLSLFIAPSLLNGLAERHVPELFAPSMKRERHGTDRCGSKCAFNKVCVTERETCSAVTSGDIGQRADSPAISVRRCWSTLGAARHQHQRHHQSSETGEHK